MRDLTLMLYIVKKIFELPVFFHPISANVILISIELINSPNLCRFGETERSQCSLFQARNGHMTKLEKLGFHPEDFDF